MSSILEKDVDAENALKIRSNYYKNVFLKTF